MGLISYTMVVYAFASDIFIFDEQIYTRELISAGVTMAVTVGVSVHNLLESENSENEKVEQENP